MSEERITDAQERQLLAAVRGAISQTNEGVSPDEALAKAASRYNYGPDFVSRMVELYNTSRTLAHFKHASGPARAQDFPIADAQRVLGHMFPVSSRGEDIEGGELGKAANFMALRTYEDTPTLFEKAAAYASDGSAKFDRVLSAVRDLEQDVITLRTKRAEVELARDRALGAAAAYFRRPGHAPFEDVDARMRSMFGQAGKLAMDVLWESVEGLRGEKRAESSEQPRLASAEQEPYGSIDQFIEQSKSLAKLAARVESKLAELKDLKEQLRTRVTGAYKAASGLATAATLGLVGQALEGSSALSGDSEAAERAQMSALQRATDPEHENRLRAIHTEAMLHDLIASDPVISKYNPSDVVDAYNELAQTAPIGSTQPVILRGYLRRFLESSPNIRGRVLEGHEAGQLSDIEKNLRSGRESVQDVLKMMGA